MIVDLEFITNFLALTTLLISLISKPCTVIGFSSPSRWRNKVYSIAIPFDHGRHIYRDFRETVFPSKHKRREFKFSASTKTQLFSNKPPLVAQLPFQGIIF